MLEHKVVLVSPFGQEPVKYELLEKLKLELKNKRLAIKNRNTRIRNLRNNLTGTQKALEKRNKELSKAKELLRKWVNLVGFKAGKLVGDTEQFLKETEE